MKPLLCNKGSCRLAKVQGTMKQDLIVEKEIDLQIHKKQDLDKGETVGSVILDLSKAFDLIPHNLLMDKPKAYVLSTQSLNLIKDYLGGQRQQVKVANAKSDIVKIHRGVPQGSVLGPFFFNIFLNDLFYFVTEAKLWNYADDNQLTSSDVAPSLVQAVLFQAVLVQAVLVQAVLVQAVLAQAVLAQAVLVQAVLVQAVLVQAVLVQAVLVQAVGVQAVQATQRIRN
ncbi:RNA-directed DNA polymerase from mobile element jockey [Stylophora pistillata]|uniref:RNA-directed DNA polymerase from mobile element jockey n=1 Tax=Stylophora pistillata TaxID=50429 RepID=A0A2B4SDF6_STYPI|nr:RNA-directed DNA polymerase from mobile element jockey [Stylophora pistillata]